MLSFFQELLNTYSDGSPKLLRKLKVSNWYPKSLLRYDVALLLNFFGLIAYYTLIDTLLHALRS